MSEGDSAGNIGGPSDGVFRTGQLAHAVSWLQKTGIEPAPLADAMVGSVVAIEDLSRALLARTLAYRKAGKAPRQSMALVRVEGHLPPAVVGFLITLMVEACGRWGVGPPAGLVQLLRAHLGADSFAAQKLKAPDAFSKAARYRLAYPEADNAEIARHAGVSRPRVSQWIQAGSLDRAVNSLRQWFPDGDLAKLTRLTTPRA